MTTLSRKKECCEVDIDQVIDRAEEILCFLIVLRDRLELHRLTPGSWNNYSIYNDLVEKVSKCIRDVGDKYFRSQTIDTRNLLKNRQDDILIIFDISTRDLILNLICKAEEINEAGRGLQSVFTNLVTDLLLILGCLDLKDTSDNVIN